MHLIVGLGNPGKEYSQTRHNVGFMVIEELCRRLGVSLTKDKRANALTAEVKQPQPVVLVQPQTYMNLSGEAVGKLARWFKQEPEHILVVYDDLDLPPGKLRIRTKGSAGGHNGIKSIIEHLNSENFPRIKIGIGRPAPGHEVVAHVLKRFLPEERALIEEAVKRAADAVLHTIEYGVTAAMNKYN